MVKRLLILPIVVGALLVAARAARAQSPTPSADDVNRVARQLYCPVCQNIPLDVCPTEACAKWRDTIREKLAAGWQDQQILDYFRAQYGDRVLANPTARGFNILIWVIPPIVLAAGALFLWSFLRGETPGAAPAETAPPAVPADKYVEQLEKELEKRR
jgi:cytochrome c-type biogenesis protein CcmH